MIKIVKTKAITVCSAILVLLFLFMPMDAHAESQYQLASVSYQSSEGYEMSSPYRVSYFRYGEKALGEFTLSGTVNKEATIDGVESLAVTDGLTVGYSYDGSYKSKEKESWNITSDPDKTVAEIALTKKIEGGVFIIQKSTDRVSWVDAREPIFNLFSARKIDWNNLYTATDFELKNGTYYRVIIAYKMGRKTGTDPGSVIPPKLPSDIYEYIYCSEVYEFFACYGNSQLSFRYISSQQSLSSGAVVQDGFIINKNGSSNKVTVKRDSGSPITVDSLASFTNAGKYTITETTPLGQTYTYSIKVSGGIKTVSMSPVIYQNNQKDGYTIDNKVKGNTAFGISSHTFLTIGQNSSAPITRATHNGVTAYGITGSRVSLYLRLQKDELLAANGWEIVADTWGKRKNQYVDGVDVEQVSTGALIIQTSSDGSNWINEDKGRYANGLNSTDYETHYGDRGDVLIYTPDGKSVVNGVYIRILYAYEIKNSALKEDYRIIEEYKFYLCNNELDAVTFHNLSSETTLEEICEEYDDATARIYQKSETLLSGAYTVTGFRIDTDLNPTVTYSVTCNGARYTVPSTKEITQTGKYEITLKSAVGSEKTVTIYVDRRNTDEALAGYFGECFIEGKRIYSEGEYAVFEGGLTKYQILAVDESYFPVSGTITNLTTGEAIEIPADRLEQSETLNTPGLYEAILSTNPAFEIEGASGDCRTFIFHFSIIAEGTAPGPVVNQKSLANYAKTTISDSYPKYYGLTYPSANKGYITLAFATREAAVDYARKYEQGMVEPQADGSYRYIGSINIQQKEKYDSNWDLMDAVEFFANQAVQELYFDLSEEFKVTTLTDDTIDATRTGEGNKPKLRTLELSKSVIVFADGEKQKLTSLNAFPIISAKPYYYLEPGPSGKLSKGYNDFKFITDEKYRCDSDSVTIIDFTGKSYPIEYDRGVGEQLSSYGCPSGIVTIEEKTIYGDKATYQAVYIADGDNTAKVTMSYYMDDSKEERTFNQDNADEPLTAEAFSIQSIQDELDPYCLVIVKHGDSEDSYVADLDLKDAWADPGTYTIKVVNRLGFSYSFTVNVIESDFATISFAGEGTEGVEYIITKYGEKHCELPEISRYGYTLVGFQDMDDVLYKDEISSIPYRGSVTLTAVWEAKQYQLTLKEPDGSTIITESIDFGKEKQLPVPTLHNGYTFIGWSLDGTMLESNTFTLRTENDVTLVAVGKQINTPAEDAEGTKSTSEKNSAAWIIPVVIVILAAGGIITLKKIRKTDNKKQAGSDAEFVPLPRKEDNDEE